MNHPHDRCTDKYPGCHTSGFSCPFTTQAYLEGDIGVSIDEGEQIEYNSWFAGVCHKNGMLVGMKNAVELVPLLHKQFDFAINESCFDYDECEVRQIFSSKNRP